MWGGLRDAPGPLRGWPEADPLITRPHNPPHWPQEGVSFHNQNLIIPRSVIIPPPLVHSHRGNDQEGGYRAQLQPLQSHSQRPRGVPTSQRRAPSSGPRAALRPLRCPLFGESESLWLSRDEQAAGAPLPSLEGLWI